MRRIKEAARAASKASLLDFPTMNVAKVLRGSRGEEVKSSNVSSLMRHSPFGFWNGRIVAVSCVGSAGYDGAGVARAGAGVFLRVADFFAGVGFGGGLALAVFARSRRGLGAGSGLVTTDAPPN